MEEIKSHGIFSFKDEKTQPDPVFEYPSNIANSGIPLVIDNGKNFNRSCIKKKIVHCHFLNTIKVEKIIVHDNIWDR